MNRRRKWVVVGLSSVAALLLGAVLVGSCLGFFGVRAAEKGLKALFAAQWEFHSRDRDGDGYLEFAPDVSSLGDVPGRVPGYEWKVFAVPGEMYAPDGGLLSGFIVAAVPGDASATVVMMDHAGKVFRVPGPLLEEWLERYPGGERQGGN